ncbi:sensor domain-containing diguanylate cyclase [Gracilibacillus massiliensis]|uniref:sensor domain-containing diguanylate cyclase n=1 Tax=Gracilibacillus massiliensis TaxID=1564956 RepID=UPI00071C4A3E|nr:sensor domain-containing diguanylate cyclase [Gracilibacillus massiliensis]
MSGLAQSILDSIHDQIALLNEEGTIIKINQSWIDFSNDNGGSLKYTGIGNNYLKFCPKMLKKGILSVLHGEKEYFHYEYPCHSNNDLRWFLLRVTPILLENSRGVVMAHINITDRKITELQLERNEQLYRHITEHSTDLITLHTIIGEYSYVSPMSLSLLGYDENEMLGHSIYEFMHPNDRKEVTIFNEFKALTEAIYTNTYRMRRKDGEYIWIESKFKFIKPVKQHGLSVISISRDVTEKQNQLIDLEKEKDKLQTIAITDALTGILNRHSFQYFYSQIHQQYTQEGHGYALLVIDIDFFKQYNDTYGHQEGDQCLITVANKLAHTIRKGDNVYRIGGEEFCVMMPNATEKDAAALAERLCVAIEELEIPHEMSEISRFVTVSVGVATTDRQKDATPMDSEQIFDLADQALYIAKDKGRNQVQYHQ